MLQRFPDLGAHGFGTPAPLDPADFACQVATVGLWMKKQPLIARRVLTRTSSYRAKHFIEREMGTYVSNGATMVGAVIGGYDLKRGRNGGPNAGFIEESQIPAAEPPAQALRRVSRRVTVMKRKLETLNPEFFPDEYFALLRRIFDHERGLKFILQIMRV